MTFICHKAARIPWSSASSEECAPKKGTRWLLQAFSADARPSDALLVAGKGNPKFLESLQEEFPLPAVTFAYASLFAEVRAQ